MNSVQAEKLEGRVFDASTTLPRKANRALSVWELPASLMTPPHEFRKRTRKRGRERSHYPAILAFIHRNRFVTTSQVQRRFAKFLKSDRTARRHLAEMQDSLGYLDLIVTPSPLWPKVFAVSQRGLKKLANSFQAKGRTWIPLMEDRKRKHGFSMHHVVHELFISEFLLGIWQSTQNQLQIELLSAQRRSLAKHPAFELDSGRLIPDAMYLLKHRDRGQICTFIELDTGSMSPTQLKGKFARYEQWAASERGRDFLTSLYRQYGSEDPRPVFRVAIVCGAYRSSSPCQRIGEVQQCLAETSEQLRRRCWITATTHLLNLQGASTFGSPIWHRFQVARNEWTANQRFFEVAETVSRTKQSIP